MRISRNVVGVVMALGVLLAAAPLNAHHSFSAAFDENRPFNIQGRSPRSNSSIPIPGSGLTSRMPTAALKLGHRGRSSHKPLSERHHQRHLTYRNRDQAVWLSGQERRNERRGRVRRISRWPQGLYGRFRSWRGREQPETISGAREFKMRRIPRNSVAATLPRVPQWLSR